MGTLNANIVAPPQTVEGDAETTAMWSDLTAPAATVTGELYTGAATSGDCTQAAPTTTGELITGNVLSAAVVAPAAEVTSRAGDAVEVTQPAATMTAELTSGNVMSAALTAPAQTAEGEGTSQNMLTAAITAPKATVSSTLAQGQTLSADLTAPAQVAYGTAVVGNVSTVDVDAPVPVVVSTLSFGQILTAAVTAPAQEVVAGLVNDILETFVGWLMNTESGGVTNYTEYPFHSLVEFNGQYYGVSDSGVFLLEGDNDDGADIDSTLEFGISDLGHDSLHRLGEVVVDMRASGGMRLHVTIDGEDTTHTYKADPIRPGLHPVPVPTGRGLRSRHWQFSITNVGGADFDITAIDFGDKENNRRAG